MSYYLLKHLWANLSYMYRHRDKFDLIIKVIQPKQLRIKVGFTSQICYKRTAIYSSRFLVYVLRIFVNTIRENRRIKRFSHHSQKWWVLCSFAYLRWRRRDVCNFLMIYIDDIIHNCMCVIFWTWKWYLESSWIKWNKN